jgi:hypothetical protein
VTVDGIADRDRDQPYVAHYSWPAEPADEPDQERLAAEQRESARSAYLARWRGLRYIIGVVLVCVSIAGAAFAVLSVVNAFSARGAGTTTLVLSVTPGGGETTLTLTAAQAMAVAVAMVLLETLTVCAACLLFAKRLHGRFWLVVTAVALLSSGVAAWAWATGRHDPLSLFSPLFYACPIIAIAGLAQLVRTHRLRARWG